LEPSSNARKEKAKKPQRSKQAARYSTATTSAQYCDLRPLTALFDSPVHFHWSYPVTGWDRLWQSVSLVIPVLACLVALSLLQARIEGKSSCCRAGLRSTNQPTDQWPKCGTDSSLRGLSVKSNLTVPIDESQRRKGRP